MLISSLESSLALWEHVEYVAEAVVIVGAAGEGLGEFTNLFGTERSRKDLVLKISTLVLIVGLAVELGSLVRINRLSGQMVADSEEHAIRANREADKYRLQIARSNERAARAEELAEGEHLARIKIEEDVAWRTLSNRQKNEIALALKQFLGESAEIIYNANDLEGYSFASDLAEALHEAKWDVSEPLAVLSMRQGPVPLGTNPQLETGVMLSSTNDEASIKASDVLLLRLLSMGFDTEKSTNVPRIRARPERTVFIFVQLRPKGPQGEAKLRNKNR
jgi:hypothetical protein